MYYQAVGTRPPESQKSRIDASCRWGWKNVEGLEQVVANYSAAGLPLEVVWSDIEYMPKFWTMEFDPGDCTPYLCSIKSAQTALGLRSGLCMCSLCVCPILGTANQ